jgi:hypothetical protein
MPALFCKARKANFSMKKNMTRAELQSYVSASASNAIYFAVDHNPRTGNDETPGVYELIHAMCPGEFPIWTLGLERSETARDEMAKFLLTKADLTPDPLRFALSLVAAIPANPNADNWTVPIN